MALLPQLHLHTFLTISLFLLSLIFLFIRSRRRSSATNLNLPPSPPRLPIIGNLHHLSSLPHRSLRELAQKYGPELMLLHLGQAPTLVVSSVNMVREILMSHDIAFSDRPKSTAADILLYGCKDVGFAPYGEYWGQVRKVCVVELLSMKRVQEFQFVRDQEIAVLVDKIRQACLTGASVNLSDMLVAVSNNVMGRCVLGKCFVGKMELIEQHKDALENSNYGSDSKDFVDILLKLQHNQILNFELTRNDIKAILADMFIGGSDTTSTVLEWLMAELMRNPNVMKKVQEEARRVVAGKKSKIDTNDINQMEYLKCVVKETVRLHPPIPLLLPRQTTSKVGVFHIPAKTKVFINAWAIQRDPRFWDKPEEFLPERFMNSNFDFKGHDLQMIPFGIERRGCPGISFGVASTEFVAANLLYWFDWKLPGDDHGGSGFGKELDMSEVNALTVTKKLPLHLVPIPYSP
ncbi:hypothetical protein FNV43_RR26430 [Rhamnella rubrinervis]|uniref:Cytochrome P450 71A1 n=1 Tax=Rhamnella rubrinervis TaxID=2594499 RepID=A0A8K0GP85_9ROSA|nr:hypothetical protein FNV43_RR26430 [Rhamnella rubrinervis]